MHTNASNTASDLSCLPGIYHHMTCMYPPPHMTCIYKYRERSFVSVYSLSLALSLSHTHTHTHTNTASDPSCHMRKRIHACHMRRRIHTNTASDLSCPPCASGSGYGCDLCAYPPTPRRQHQQFFLQLACKCSHERVGVQARVYSLFCSFNRSLLLFY